MQAVVRAFLSLCFGACALLASLGDAQQQATAAEAREPHVPSDIVVTEAHIFIIKFSLRLRPEQEPHWAPVEGALRDLARRQALARVGPTSVGRHADRAATGTEVAARLRQIAALARPLIRALDDNQRHNMLTLARTAGLEQLLLTAR